MLRDYGYLVASLRHVGGPADLLAIATVQTTPQSSLIKRPLLIEVKGTTDYPWRSSWGPERRAEMTEAGKRYWLEPMLAWWPPGLRGGPMWIPAEDWPRG